MDEQHVVTIDPELLLQEMRSGRAITILDVRERAAYRGSSGRIPGARCMPLHQLLGRCAELGERRNELVVVVSGRGFRSRVAAAELRIAGFDDVRSLEGGMARWLDLGHPVEHASVPPSDGAVPSARIT